MRFTTTLLLIVFCASLHAAVDIDKNDMIKELLSEGVKEYRVGRYTEAAASFEAALTKDMTNQQAYDLYLRLGPEYLLRMREKSILEGVIDDILGRARVYQKNLRKSKEYIDGLISKLSADEKTRIVATSELVAVGPRAVPALVQCLKDNREDMQRVRCRVVLTRMGNRAVMPLIKVLASKDERLVTTVLTILTDIGDSRALPQIKALLESGKISTVLESVAKNSTAGICRMSGIPTLDDASVLYFSEALRYFRGLSDVQDEMIANESFLWRFDASSDVLSFVTAPTYAWNELVTEELLFEAANLYGSHGGYQPLLACALAAQDVEAILRYRLAKERTIKAATADEKVENLEIRVKALDEIKDRVLMFGVANICRAIQQSIVSERYNVATYLMQILQDDWVTWPENTLPSKLEGLATTKPGTVLVAALDHGEKTVRYQAAVTLAHLDPKLNFYGSSKVMPLLAEAVGEWGMKVVLVVEPDWRHRNAARHALREKGFLVITAQNGFEAVQRMHEAPIKDAIIIAGDLAPVVRDEYGEIIPVPEQTAPTLIAKMRTFDKMNGVPFFVSLPENEELALEVKKVMKDKVKSFLKKPYNGVEMGGEIDAALKDAELPRLNREDRETLSFRAAEALASIDVTNTNYVFKTDLLIDSLLETLVARSDNIRIQTLRALGHFGPTDKIERIIEVYKNQDQELKPDVRAAFLYCLGLLDPSLDSARDIISKALKHGDREVRRAASFAVGAGRTLTLPHRYEFEAQQRIDAREVGAEQE